MPAPRAKKKSPAATTKRRVTKTAPKKKAPARKTVRRAASPQLNMLDTLIDKYAGSDWLSFANRQRNALSRDIRALSEEIVHKIATSPIFAQRDELLREVRGTLDALMHRINSTSLIAKAIDCVKNTPSDILSLLNIPNHLELKSLQKKLNRIETQLGGSRVAKAGKTRRSALQ